MNVQKRNHKFEAKINILNKRSHTRQINLNFTPRSRDRKYTNVRVMMKYLYLLLITLLIGCNESYQKTKNSATKAPLALQGYEDALTPIQYAQGFEIKTQGYITYVQVKSPWPNAKAPFTYALISKQHKKELKDSLDYLRSTFDALIFTPVDKVIATSTTQIPAFELLEVSDHLIGFPGTDYISSPAIRARIESGQIKELGTNESLNEEVIITSGADLFMGFGVSSQSKSYTTISKAGLPVVYNGDWVEETPLGKAEWIKFMGAFFEKQQEADHIFNTVVDEYHKAKKLALKATSQPTVISGSMFKDIWYAPAGDSWLAQFFSDANANYLWKDTDGTGSLSLNFETVLMKARATDYWIGSGQFTNYSQLKQTNPHYEQFEFFKQKNIFTYALSIGDKGGMLYYELAPTRPDMVLKDIIHILHPDLLPDYTTVFFKPLQP